MLTQAAPVNTLPPVSVAVRLTYTLHDWTQYSWPQQPPGGVNFIFISVFMFVFQSILKELADENLCISI